MKNIKIKNSSVVYFLCYASLLSNCINAAEIISRPIKRSFCPNNSSDLYILQPKSTQPQSSLYYFPQEIKDKIIRTLCNISEATAVKITIEDAVRYYHSIKKYCPLTVGNRIYDTDELILLTHLQKQNLITFANPSNLNKRMGFSPELLSVKEARVLDAMPDHIRQNLSVEIFDPHLEGEAVVGLLYPYSLLWGTSTVHLVNLLKTGAFTLELLATFGATCILTAAGVGCCCAFYNPTCAECIGKHSVIKSQYKHKKEY